MYDKLTLPNGVRIVSEHMDGVRSASIGIWVGAGSRYEKLSEAGSAHFIEHMLFKGTGRYTAAQLAGMMDELGGQINAYTTRDSTCFYARVLDTALPLAIDVLCDMFFDSNFDDGDVRNERGVILDEIDMYEDTPEDVASERLLSGCFPGALGRPVLGRAGSLEKQTGGSLRAFKNRHYVPERIVVALSGSFADGDIDKIAARFGALEKSRAPRFAESVYTPHFTLRKKSNEQNQLVMGFPGPAIAGEDRYAMQLFSGILGGNASSRLFQNVREKCGLCYSIYTYSAPFEDCGMFAVAAATGRDTEDRALGLITDELRRIRESGVTEEEFDRSRRQVISSILMSLESTSARMNRLGYGELFLGACTEPDALIERYEAVTRQDVLEAARRTLRGEQMSFSAVGRLSGEEHYRELLAL